MPTFSLTLDVHKRTPCLPQQVMVRVGDVSSQVITARLTDDGVAYVPSSGTTARLDVLKADGTWVRQGATLSGSTVTVTLASQAVSSPGDARLAHFVLVRGTRAESTEGFALRVLPNVDATAEESASYNDELAELYRKWLAYEARAEAQESARVSAESVRQSNESARQATYVASATARTLDPNSDATAQLVGNVLVLGIPRGATGDASGLTGTLPVSHGGTGATDAATARSNIGAAATSHTHSAADVTSGTLPVTRGGTGATTASAARTALGVGNLPVYYYSAKPSESSITVKPCLVVVSDGSVYLVK